MLLGLKGLESIFDSAMACVQLLCKVSVPSRFNGLLFTARIFLSGYAEQKLGRSPDGENRNFNEDKKMKIIIKILTYG